MTASRIDVAARYGFTLATETGRHNLPPPELFPKRPAWTVCNRDGERNALAMTWGFPMLIRSKGGKPHVRNVTNVRHYDSKFWHGTIANPARRCLVPFTSFCEWEGDTPGDKLERWFQVPSQPITSFAGIWRPTDNGPVMAFLTCAPNPLVAPIHPKAMPVLLHQADEDHWLSTDFDGVIALARPFPSQLMDMR